MAASSTSATEDEQRNIFTIQVENDVFNRLSPTDRDCTSGVRIGWLSPANIAYLHTLVPQPTHLFLLDLPAEAALERIEARLEATGEPRGMHETLEQLTVHRERYLGLADDFPHLHIIDATRSEDEIHDAIWRVVETWTEPPA